MSIQTIVEETNKLVGQMLDTGKPDKRVLAVAVEIHQQYAEYLDELLASNLSTKNGVDVLIDGVIVHFESVDDFSEWVSDHE